MFHFIYERRIAISLLEVLGMRGHLLGTRNVAEWLAGQGSRDTRPALTTKVEMYNSDLRVVGGKHPPPPLRCGDVQ